jgi:hypothetical protein
MGNDASDDMAAKKEAEGGIRRGYFPFVIFHFPFVIEYAERACCSFDGRSEPRAHQQEIENDKWKMENGKSRLTSAF